MNFFLGIVWFLVTLTVATEPLADGHRPDANNGYHEMRQIAAGGFVLPDSSLVTQNTIVVATATATGGLFSNATSIAVVNGAASSAVPSFIPVNPTSHFFDPAPIPKETISTLVTVATVNLPQETSTDTDVILTTLPSAQSATGGFKDAPGVAPDTQTTSQGTALPASSSAPAEIVSTVTLIPIEASSSQSSDLMTESASSFQVTGTPVSSLVVSTTPASTASFTSIRLVGTPVANPSSPNSSPAGESHLSVQVSDSASATFASIASQSSQSETQPIAPSNDANSHSTISSTTTSTTTLFTTTTLTHETLTSTVTLSSTPSTQSSVSSIISQSLIDKLISGGSLSGETIIEKITSGSSTYTTTETGPCSTITRSIAINPAFNNSASSVSHFPTDTAAGLAAGSSASPFCTCPTPQTVTVTQTVSPLSSVASFTPQVPPSDGFVGIPAITSSSALETIALSKSGDILEPVQSTTHSYSSWPSFLPAAPSSSFTPTISPIYPSSSSVVASLSKTMPYPNSTTPSTSPPTYTSAADFQRLPIGTEGLALVVGFVALFLLF
ncbi:hypothetical protein ACMFMG_003805 [Clarireedia jacksonii]